MVAAVLIMTNIGMFLIVLGPVGHEFVSLVKALLGRDAEPALSASESAPVTATEARFGPSGVELADMHGLQVNPMHGELGTVEYQVGTPPRNSTEFVARNVERRSTWTGEDLSSSASTELAINRTPLDNQGRQAEGRRRASTSSFSYAV